MSLLNNPSIPQKLLRNASLTLSDYVEEVIAALKIGLLSNKDANHLHDALIDWQESEEEDVNSPHCQWCLNNPPGAN